MVLHNDFLETFPPDKRRVFSRFELLSNTWISICEGS